MKNTLLLRLQGPMQAWGVQSRFSVRETAREPSKSGLLGLVCAAMGRDRTMPIDDLLHLRMGVRVDREGKLMVDFHTAQSVLNAAGAVLRNAVLSNRYYLADAVFLVGLESEDLPLLASIQNALRQPRWLLALGRRAFPPAAPLWLPDGLRTGETLETALQNYPWLIAPPKSEWEQTRMPKELRWVLEAPGGWIHRSDFPRSFSERAFARQSYAVRLEKAPKVFFHEEPGG